MKVFKIDPYLINASSKGALLSIVIATLFNDFEKRLKAEEYKHNYFEKKQVLELFQTVYSACDYITNHDLSESKEYYGGMIVEDIARGANAVNIPNTIKELLLKFCEFMNYDKEFEFVFEVVTEAYRKDVMNKTDYLVRSIFKECDISKYNITAKNSIIIRLGV